MRTFLLLATLAVAPACDTSNATVPAVDRDAAIQLVIHDLDVLAASPSQVHWRRAYRHFDRHLEPHVDPTSRLRLEVAFGELRRNLKLGPPDKAFTALVGNLKKSLQPQD